MLFCHKLIIPTFWGYLYYSAGGAALPLGSCIDIGLHLGVLLVGPRSDVCFSEGLGEGVQGFRLCLLLFSLLFLLGVCRVFGPL